jgi:hypothetical protein
MSIGKLEKENKGRVKPKTVTPVRIVSATKSASVVTITFDQPIVLNQTPKYTTDVVDVTAVSATSPTINSIAVTFSASIAAATELMIPYIDQGVRSKDGGYVFDSTFPLA